MSRKLNMRLSVGLVLTMLFVSILYPVAAFATNASDFEPRLLTQEEVDQINADLAISSVDTSESDAIENRVKNALPIANSRSFADSAMRPLRR